MTELSVTGKKQYKYFTYLCCLFITFQFLCDILVLRLFKVGSIEFTASSAIFCLNFAMMDIIANVYGMVEAKRLTLINFVAQFICAIFLYSFLITFNPALYGNVDYQAVASEAKAFGLILSKNLLIIPFSVLVGNFANALLMSLSKYLLYGRMVALRSLICSAVSALVMLSISYTKIYWVTGWPFIIHVIMSSMAVKVVGAAFLMAPAQYLSHILKQKEGVDVYDLKFKFLQARQKRILEMMKRGTLQ